MRVCPRCGYSDNLLWRNCAFKYDLVYMRLEDFQQEYPEIWEHLKSQVQYYDGQFMYRRSKLYVRRKEPTDPKQPFNENFESADRKTPTKTLAQYGIRKRLEVKAQTKLLEVHP